MPSVVYKQFFEGCKGRRIATPTAQWNTQCTESPSQYGGKNMESVIRGFLRISWFNICAVALVALVLAGCSGGSGTPAPPPKAPSIKYPSTTVTFAAQYDNTVTPSNSGG